MRMTRNSQFFFSAIVALGLGRNLFPPATASSKEMVTAFKSTPPQLEFGSATLPTKRLGTDSVFYSFSLELDCAHTNAAMRAESAALWHRRLGHINRKSLDVLRKVEGNGVEYNEYISACDVCAIGKSTQPPHPKKTTYGVERPFEHIVGDTMGPITPPALGGFNYVRTFVDQKTKWGEIFIIKAKSSAIDTRSLFVRALVIPYWTVVGASSDGQGRGMHETNILGVLPPDRHQADVRSYQRSTADRRERAKQKDARRHGTLPPRRFRSSTLSAGENDANSSVPSEQGTACSARHRHTVQSFL